MNTNQILSKTKELIKKINKRTWVTCSAVLIIGIAVLLNVLFLPKSNDNTADGVISPTINLNDISASIEEQDQSAEKVDVFAEMTLTRKQARDEAIDVLNTLANNSSASIDAKNSAYEDIEVLAACIESETNIESLIKAKGFVDCVAVISNDNASIVIKTEEALAPNQIAQISEIVYEQAGILPVNLNIIESE